MVGGGNKRDDVSQGISSTNIFATLDNRRRKSSKKKSDKDQGSTFSRNNSKDKSDQKSAEPQQFWAPAPVTAKSWADVDDDEDYYATTAPPPPVWGSQPPVQSNEDTRANLSQAEVYIFAYGQTESGKTYTMLGWPDEAYHKGLIPRSLEQIFNSSQTLRSKGWKFKMHPCWKSTMRPYRILPILTPTPMMLGSNMW